MPKNIREHLSVTPKFSGFNVDHLDKMARDLPVRIHNLTENHPVHKRVLKSLRKIDKSNEKTYPQLNVNLEKKYKSIKRLAGGLGDADGEILVEKFAWESKGKPITYRVVLPAIRALNLQGYSAKDSVDLGIEVLTKYEGIPVKSEDKQFLRHWAKRNLLGRKGYYTKY